MIIDKKITIIRIRKPVRPDINERLHWFGSSLGLFSMRDRDKSCFRLFIELLKAAKLKVPMSSDDIARHLGLSRGTVVHHLNKLIESGIVVHHQNHYLLRVDSLKHLVNELRRDFERDLSDLEAMAEEIDKYMTL